MRFTFGEKNSIINPYTIRFNGTLDNQHLATRR